MPAIRWHICYIWFSPGSRRNHGKIIDKNTEFCYNNQRIVAERTVIWQQ